MASVGSRFWQKVEKTPECWVWTGAVTHDGYGRVRVGGQEYLAARHLYEETCGDVGSDEVLYHECGNPACVRPDHMSVRTCREFTEISAGPTSTNARRMRCSHGHPLEGDNLYLDPEGKRKCRTCMRRIQEERAARFTGPRRPKPTRVVLAREMETSTFVEIAECYGVSDTTVRNWARGYGLR